MKKPLINNLSYCILRKCTIILLFLFYVNTLFAQSEQSNDFFSLGVDFYNKGDYKTASAYFEEVVKLDIVEIDSLDNRQSYSKDWLANSLYLCGKIEDARKISPYSYRCKPVDRRLTLDLDKLSKEIEQDIKRKDFSIALSKLQKLDSLENQICDAYNIYHTGTYFAFAITYLNLNMPDSAFNYFEKKYLIEKSCLENNDTLLLSSLDDIVWCAQNTQKYDKALQYNEEKRQILQHNNLLNSANLSSVTMIQILSLIGNRDFYSVKYRLNDIINTLQMCYILNPQSLSDKLKTISFALKHKNLLKESCFVDSVRCDVLHNLDFKNYLEASTIYAFDLINLGQSDISLKVLGNLRREMELRSIESFKEEYYSIMCAEMVAYVNKKDFSNANIIYEEILSKNVRTLKIKNAPFYFYYLIAKELIEVSRREWNYAIKTIEELIENVQLDTNTKNELKIQKACFLAIDKKYDKSSRIISGIIEYYRENKNINRIEKDTLVISQAIKFLNNYYTYTELNDSAKYLISGYLYNFHKLRIEMLELLPKYLLELDYVYELYYCALSLTKQRKYTEAHEILKDYRSKLNNKYLMQKVDKNDFEYLSARIALDVFLELQTKIYEKGDPNGIAAHKEYVEFQKESYEGEITGAYFDALVSYYKYIGDHKGLVEAYNNKKDIDYKTFLSLANEYKEINNDTLAVHFSKMFISGALMDYVSFKKHRFEFMNCLGILNKYYEKEKADTLIFEYYVNDLFITLDNIPSEYRLPYFFISIAELKRHICAETAAQIVDVFVERNPRLFVGNRMFFLLLAKADILACTEGGMQKALDAIDLALQNCKSEHMKIKTLCYKYDILSAKSFDNSTSDQLMSCGAELMKYFTHNPQTQKCREYLAFIDGYVRDLYYHNNYSEVRNTAMLYLKSIGGQQDYENTILVNEEDAGLLFISEPTLWGYEYVDICTKNIKEYLQNANIALNKSSDKLALEVVKNKLDDFSDAIKSINNPYVESIISESSYFAHLYKSDSLCMYAYDAALLCKGFQMRSYQTIRNMVKKSGHNYLNEKIEELHTTISQMNNAYDKELDSLIIRKQSLERLLCNSINMLGDYYGQLYISWKDIRNKLHKDEIAIEFTMGMDNLKYNSQYFACVITQDTKFPHIVYLCEKDSLLATNIHDYDKISKLIWEPLHPYIKNKKNIYFSPYGEIQNLPIESLPHYEETGTMMAERYNIYRLSSTRELLITDKVRGDGATVFGGLLYDITLEDMVSDSENYLPSNVTTNTILNRYLSRNAREATRSLTYLPGTREEAFQVSQIINKEKFTTNTLVGHQGTEASFKSLSGGNIKILHIATHGFYYTQKEFDAFFEKTSNKKDKQQHDEYYTMQRSGLLFAGADNVLQGGAIPDGVEDGILTSFEISTLNFVGLDLVTLSACETAKGDITGDGVFGLQRGFKKAGANSILMSLWKVDDAATCKLMTEFYSNWIGKKMTKHDALEAAKKTVRETKGWEDPKYWAAFIMLDGLD